MQLFNIPLIIHCARLNGQRPSLPDLPPFEQRPALIVNRKKSHILIVGPFNQRLSGGVGAFVRGLAACNSLSGQFQLEKFDSARRLVHGASWPRRVLNTLELTPRLVFRLLKGGVNLVHVHSSAGGPFYQKALLTLLCRLLGAKTVLHIHGGSFPEFYERSRRKWMIRLLLKNAGKVVTVSRKLSDFMAGHCGCEATVAPNFAERKFFSASADPRSGSAILFSGTLSTGKGIAVLLDALAKLRRRGFGNPLVLAGLTSGDISRAELLSMVNDNNLEPVTLLEDVGAGRILSLLEEAAVFTLPSFAEGMPISLLEAMAAGVPVVVTNAGGMAEAVADGDEGFVVEPGDSGQLAGRLAELLENPKLRSAMGERGRATAAARFHPERTGETLATIYHSLAG